MNYIHMKYSEKTLIISVLTTTKRLLRTYSFYTTTQQFKLFQYFRENIGKPLKSGTYHEEKKHNGVH